MKDDRLTRTSDDAVGHGRSVASEGTAGSRPTGTPAMEVGTRTIVGRSNSVDEVRPTAA